MEKMTIRDEETKKNLNNRISRIKGQLDGISKMIDENKYCIDILTQLSSIESTVKSLSNEILKNHIKKCVKRDLTIEDEEVINEIVYAIKKFE